MKYTRDDVAKLAGVSSATVSRVFNKSPKVSKEKIELVEKAAKELNYLPNKIARKLKIQESNTLVYVVNDIKNPLHGEIVDYFQKEAYSKGYSVNLLIADELKSEHVEEFISNNVGGVVISNMPTMFSYKVIEQIKKENLPFVTNRMLGEDIGGLCIVDSDFDKGIRKAVEHLMALGHKKIGYIDGEKKDTKYDVRYKAFVKTLLDNNLEINTAWHMFNNDNTVACTELGFNLAKQLINTGMPVTGIICHNDVLALGAMVAFKKYGYVVPDDISVIGYDNIDFCTLVYPNLTSVNMPKKDIAVNMFNQLMKQIKGEKAENITLKTDLIIRDSTAKPRI